MTPFRRIVLVAALLNLAYFGVEFTARAVWRAARDERLADRSASA